MMRTKNKNNWNRRWQKVYWGLVIVCLELWNGKASLCLNMCSCTFNCNIHLQFILINYCSLPLSPLQWVCQAWVTHRDINLIAWFAAPSHSLHLLNRALLAFPALSLSFSWKISLPFVFYPTYTGFHKGVIFLKVHILHVSLTGFCFLKGIKLLDGADFWSSLSLSSDSAPPLEFQAETSSVFLEPMILQCMAW